MTTNQKPPARPPTKSAGSDATPSAVVMQYSFAPPKWIDPHDYRQVNIPAGQACDLVNSVLDVVSGVTTVMELIAAHQEDEDSDVETSYLNPFHLGNLNRLSIFALNQLGNEADRLREAVRSSTTKS